MNLFNDISLTRLELTIGLVALTGSLILVSGSRLSRLTNTAAIQSDNGAVEIYLHEKTGLTALSELMADSGLIDSREEMEWAGNLLGWRNFSRGHYQVDGGYSYDVLLSRMARGIQDPINLTIFPGSYEQQLVSGIASQFYFDSTEFDSVLNDSALLAGNGINNRELMGRLLPDTYSMYWTSTPQAVIERVLREFRTAVIEPHSARIEELGLTVNEVVTLASIIEWEANHEEEKPRISGLYWNRLNRGMRLQADPTVNFAIGERRRLLFADYEFDHPYNTYLYSGLPPGPITNPSLSSIEAALYPEDHSYLYMVANPEGGHIFTETFEEHRLESAKWREWLEEQYRIQREQETQSEGLNS